MNNYYLKRPCNCMRILLEQSLVGIISFLCVDAIWVIRLIFSYKSSPGIVEYIIGCTAFMTLSHTQSQRWRPGLPPLYFAFLVYTISRALFPGQGMIEKTQVELRLLSIYNNMLSIDFGLHEARYCAFFSSISVSLYLCLYLCVYQRCGTDNVRPPSE